MAIIDFPGPKNDQRMHITIQYEDVGGEAAFVNGVGYLTSMAGFVCISTDADMSANTAPLPPVLIPFERVVRIDTDALPQQTN